MMLMMMMIDWRIISTIYGLLPVINFGDHPRRWALMNADEVGLLHLSHEPHPSSRFLTLS